MTALDDGLNTSAPVFNPATIKAEWLDLPPGYEANVLVDSIQQLGDQVGPQGVEVSQSIDDGLPDPVSMTGGNDASGSLTSDLVGRPGVEIDPSTIDFTGYSNGITTGTEFTPSEPGGIEYLDYTLLVVTATSDVAVWEDPSQVPTWTVLADVVDGGYRTWVYGRKHYDGIPNNKFFLEASAAHGWCTVALKPGRTLGGAWVEVTPERAAVGVETGAGTLHTTPPVTLDSPGYVVGIFSCPLAVGPLTETGGAQFMAFNGSLVSMLVARTPLQTITPASYSVSATSALSTGSVPMVSIPFIVRERPFLDAAAYFSPFNEQSPVYGFERDTAPVTGEINVLTPEGNVPTQVFKGIMNDVPVSGRTATLDASSATRLKLDQSGTVPTVNGYREGCETDWLIGYLLARGGQYIGVCPGPNTRFWAPMYGSLHPWMDGPASFPYSSVYTTARTPGTAYRNNNFQTVDGPFVTGMYAQMKSAEVIQHTIFPDPNWATEVPGVDNPLTYDILSKQNSAGRMSVRLRGDTFDAAPAALAGAEDWLFAFTLYNLTPGGSAGNYTRYQINSDRSITVWVGNSANFSVASYPAYSFPSDGDWHMFGFAWNYALGEAKIRRDGSGTATSTGHTGNLAELPNTEAELYGRGLFTSMAVQTRIPMSEFQVEVGPECWVTQPWSPSGGGWQWMGTGVPPGLNSFNATYRPTRQPLAAVAIASPIQGWPALQALAESTLSHLRLNEQDNAEFLPMNYFGEAAQMAVSTANILDTTINAGELALLVDASRIRNQVTAQFKEVRVATSRTIIFETTSVIALPRGETFQTFALDKQTVETHGASVWQGTIPDVIKLTSSQISNPATIPNEHVMTANFLADGSGTVIASSVVTARVVSWDNSTVTIRFRNNWPSVVYLANNGSNVPTLRILGYEMESADAYATVRDPGSVSLRRERSLTTTPEWIQDRDTALDYASKLATITSRPRPQVAVTVMGDPRRKPGQLISLVDAFGTRANGTWRILACKHKQSGAMYVNSLELVWVGEIGVWDVALWDNAVWGE
jgi:hypothetical protein